DAPWARPSAAPDRALPAEKKNDGPIDNTDRRDIIEEAAEGADHAQQHARRRASREIDQPDARRVHTVIKQTLHSRPYNPARSRRNRFAWPSTRSPIGECRLAPRSA